MKGMGLDTRVGEYHVETFNDASNLRVVSQVFREGRVVLFRERGYERGIKEKDVLQLVHSLHREVTQEVQELQDIKGKIREDKNAEIEVRFGNILRRRGFLKEAEEAYRNALSLSELPDAHFGLALILMSEKRYEEAEEEFKRAIELFPDAPAYYFHYGKLMLLTGNKEKAKELFEKARELNPEYGEAYFYLGILLLEDAPDRAAMYLKHAGLIDNRFQRDKYREGLERLENGDVKGALEIMKEIERELEPVDVHPLIDEFTIFAKFSPYRNYLPTIDEIIDALETRLLEHPDSPELHNTLAKAYLVKIRALFNSAISHLQKAVELNPEYEEARKNLEIMENESKGFLLFLRVLLR